MLRIVALTWLAWCSLATAALAQNHDWANKLFSPDGNANKHDFGSVPRGAQLYHRFPMKNIWAVPIEIINVRVSCGCVKATPSKATLQKNETALPRRDDGRQQVHRPEVGVDLRPGRAGVHLDGAS